MSYLLIQKYDPPTTAIQMHLAVLDEYLISGGPCVGNLSHPRHLLGRWVKVIAMHLKDMVRYFVLSFTFPYTCLVFSVAMLHAIVALVLHTRKNVFVLPRSFQSMSVMYCISSKAQNYQYKPDIHNQ